MKSLLAFIAIVAASCTLADAANNAPLSGSWNIAPTGNAASNGELLFRMTPGDGGDPVEVTVSVRSGANDMGVARSIRQALSLQLARDRFNVQLGDGANVLVSDPHGKPNFSLELLDSDVENLRVVVQNIAAAATPTVPEQAVPATSPQRAPAASPDAPGDALPPAPPSRSTQADPAAPTAPQAPDASPATSPPANPRPPDHGARGAGAAADTAPTGPASEGSPVSSAPPRT